jgi:hypothetical protein
MSRDIRKVFPDQLKPGDRVLVECEVYDEPDGYPQGAHVYVRPTGVWQEGGGSANPWTWRRRPVSQSEPYVDLIASEPLEGETLLQGHEAHALGIARKQLGLVKHWATGSLAAAAEIAVSQAWNAGWFACRNDTEGINPFLEGEEL